MYVYKDKTFSAELNSCNFWGFVVHQETLTILQCTIYWTNVTTIDGETLENATFGDLGNRF